MGDVLQIRLIATTYRVEDVEKRWPRLAALAFSPSSPLPPEQRGVLAMVDNLRDITSFDLKGNPLSEQLAPKIEPLIQAADRLEAALANWKPAEANQASQAIEAALDDLEKLAPEA